MIVYPGAMDTLFENVDELQSTTSSTKCVTPDQQRRKKKKIIVFHMAAWVYTQGDAVFRDKALKIYTNYILK